MGKGNLVGVFGMGGLFHYPLNLDINIIILIIVLPTFPMEVFRRVCLNNKIFYLC